MPDPHRDPDHALVAACQSQDADRIETGFEGLYAKYRDRVYSISLRITGRHADAMDVLQESFSLLLRKMESFRYDSLFSTWLFRIVVNCSIDHVRHERSRGSTRSSSLSQLASGAEPTDEDASGPLDRAHRRELGEHVQAAIQRLSPKLRAILSLRYLAGQSYEELSQTLDVSMGTVKSRLARAHLALGRVLRGTLGAFGIPELDPGPPDGSDDVGEVA